MHILLQPWQPFACRVGGGTEEVEVVVGEVGGGGEQAALRMQAGEEVGCWGGRAA